MKRLFLLGILFAGPLLGQGLPYVTNKSDYVVLKSGGTSSGGSGVTPYSGTPVLGDIIYFDGTNWVSLNKPADGAYNVTFTASIPSWTSAAGGAPSDATYITQTANGSLSAEQAMGSLGTGLVKNTTTTGVQSIYAGTSCTNQFPRSLDASGAATCASVALGADVSGDLPFSNLVQSSAASVIVGRGSASGAGDFQELTAGGALSITNQVISALDPTKRVYIYDDFINGSSVSGAAAAGSFFRCNASGTGSGCNSVITSSNAVADTNTVGVWEVTTGTTTTGAGLLTSAGGGSGTAAGASVLITGGERLKVRFFVPTASDGTNTFNTFIGFCNIIVSGSCADGLWISWDNNSNTHWIVNSIKTTGGSNSVASNLVATANAWHTAEIVVNSDATSVAFYIDGAELSSSPLTTAIPTTVRTFIIPLKVQSSASTNAEVADIDYALFTKPVSR